MDPMQRKSLEIAYEAFENGKLEERCNFREKSNTEAS